MESVTLPDYLRDGLDVVFVGAAASLWSAGAGHYYAGPNNRFYLLLHRANFTGYQYQPNEDYKLLEVGIGLTGLLKNVASSANHLLPPATHLQKSELERKLRCCKPRWICYNGRDVYQMVHGEPSCGWGEQEPTDFGTRVYVAISSSARADRWGEERLQQYRELFSLVHEPTYPCSRP